MEDAGTEEWPGHGRIIAALRIGSGFFVAQAEMAKKKPTKKKSKNQADGVLIPIHWPADPGEAKFASNMIAQVDEHTVYISFFQISPPLVMGEGEQRQKQIEAIKGVNPTLVTRIAYPKEKIQGVINALQSLVQDPEGSPSDE